MQKKDEYIFAQDPGKTANRFDDNMMRSILDEQVDDGKNQLKMLEEQEKERSLKFQQKRENYADVKATGVCCCLKRCFKGRSSFQNMTTA